MPDLLWIILGVLGLALLVLPGGAWKALWQLLQEIRKVHFPKKTQNRLFTAPTCKCGLR
jgi:hypothetical protein